jgi:hypothetical protein
VGLAIGAALAMPLVKALRERVPRLFGQQDKARGARVFWVLRVEPRLS